MSATVSAHLVFVADPHVPHDMVVDVSVWHVSHEFTPCEFKDVSRVKTAMPRQTQKNFMRLLRGGSVCIMCSMDDHRRTVGCTLFSASHVVKRIRDKKPLLIRHPVNAKCIALVTFESEKRVPDAQEDTETFTLIQECNTVSQKVTSNASIRAAEMAASMGYAEAFFPPESAGRSFQNLLTVMPCTVMQPDLEVGTETIMMRALANRIYMPMPMLELVVEKQNSIVPLDWVGYNVYGACLLMGVDPATLAGETDLCNTGVHWPEFLEAFVTITTSDPAFNVYFSDLAPAAVKEEVTTKNRREWVYEWEPTEAIQRPLSGVKMAPDDCEDWAMLLKMISMAVSFHAHRIEQGRLSWEGELMRCPLLSSLSQDSRSGIAAIIRHLAWAIDNKMLSVQMSCGIAGAPSLSKDSAGGQPGGHEFCFLYADRACPGEERAYASVIEGTNWTKSTHLPVKIVEKLNMNCATVAQGIGLDPRTMRARGMQHVGSEAASATEAFWRTIVGFGDSVLVSVRGAGSENEGGVTQWGANVGRLLSYFESMGTRNNVAFLPMGEIVGEDARNGYVDGLSRLFDMVNLPKSDSRDFQRISKDWKPAVDFDQLPSAFLTRQEKHHTFFFHPEQSPGSHGVGFMGGYLYYAGLPAEAEAV